MNVTPLTFYLHTCEDPQMLRMYRRTIKKSPMSPVQKKRYLGAVRYRLRYLRNS